MKYRITIAEPCHEDWDKMTPQDKGRHCDVCDKVVMDFSKYSKRDIINHIKKEGKICGKVPRQYVGIDLEEEKTRKSFGLNGMVATMVNLLALTAITTAVGCDKPKVENIFTDSITNKDSVLKSGKTVQNTRVITGSVYDEEGNGISGATITIKGMKDGMQTDTKGMFKLVVPEKYAKSKLTLVASFIGLEDQEISVKENVNNLVFRLEVSAMVLGGLGLVTY